MSRIRGIEARLHKDLPHIKKKCVETNRNKKDDRSSDEADQQQIKELVSKLPKLQDIFNLHRKIGVGTFSSVYLGSLRQHHSLPDSEKRWFAIKHLVPNTHPARVEHELRCLQEMGGKDNIIGVELCLRHVDTIVFVMPYIPHRKFSEYVNSMDAREVREYLRALLIALRRVHSFNVIHRDVKPSNFLYDRDNKRYLLVDFGLAQRISPPEEGVPPRPASPAVPAPRARVALAISNVQAAVEPPPAHANSHAKKRLRELEEGGQPAAKRVALDLTVGPKNKDVEVTKEKEESSVPNVIVENTQVPNSKRVPVPSTPPTQTTPRCQCWGVGGVCGECSRRAGARACRAGTGGFRPPEVLLKYPHQGTAVDMWAVGVVLASLLCARYPFFRASDDSSALAELADLLGTAALQATAATLGRRLLMSRSRRGLCLRKLCARLRAGPRPAVPAAARADCAYCRLPVHQCLCPDPEKPAELFTPGTFVAGFPDSAFSLAARLLDPDPRSRISADDALQHPFFSEQL